MVSLRIITRSPKIDVDCIDASRDMLRIARRRVERKCPESLPHVRFLRCDILRWSPQASYNLLITHFFLDCFQSDQLEEIIAKLSGAASAGAVWLLADFTIPTQLFARLHALLWLSMMYTFFRAMTGITANSIVDPTSFLAANRFVRTKRKVLALANDKIGGIRGTSLVRFCLQGLSDRRMSSAVTEQHTRSPLQPSRPRRNQSAKRALSPLHFWLLAVVIGLVGGFGAFLFRGMIAFFHNLFFLGRISFLYESDIHTPPVLGDR